MRLGVVTASLSREGGGLFDAARHLACALHQNSGCEIRVFGLEDDHTAADLGEWEPVRAEAFGIAGPNTWGYSPELRRALLTADLDLLHVHGLWMYPSLASLEWSRRHHRPYLITPHGMLDPWAVNHSRWKKRPIAWLYENAHLRRATCLHALCEPELGAIRSYGLTNPVCVVPNAIHLPPEQTTSVPPWRTQVPPGAKVLLFLGRLHLKKGLVELLHGWSHVSRCGGASSEEWHLVIAGWGDALKAKLEALTRDLALKRVHLVGPQFGRDKDATYAASDAFILPSFSEGLPMAVLEAWAHALPVLMTRECNLPQGFATNAALEVAVNPVAIGHALEALFTSSDRDRREMGNRGRTLVERCFSWPSVAAEMRSVYLWMLGGGERPASVTI